MSKPKPEFVTIVVLNDGETYTDVHGCSLCVIPLEQYESVAAAGGDAKDFEPIVRIGIDSIAVRKPSCCAKFHRGE